MITYELVKELEEAGFPQHVDCHHHPAEHCRCYKDWKPTLSELIAACGEGFVSLQYIRSSNGKWAAMWVPEPLEEELEYGDTPEEAVARLWLVLNKK